MRKLLVPLMLMMSSAVFAQTPPIEPGVSQELARWRAARYSDVRYKLNLTLEKMSPVLKGTMEVRVKLSEPPALAGGQKAGNAVAPIILDWRRIKGHEEKSTISNVVVNGKAVSVAANWPPADAGGSDFNEHLIFRDGVVAGENVIKLDFTSPILPSGSASTRYVDKEDGSEYIYSLFVPSDASTAFPVFDQPDLKGRFSLTISKPLDWSRELKPQLDWKFVSNTVGKEWVENVNGRSGRQMCQTTEFDETQPISTYVFAFAAGPWEKVGAGTLLSPPTRSGGKDVSPQTAIEDKSVLAPHIYVRKSQAAKFKPHADEVFRLNREAVKYFEQYFDYKFPFPKYDLVLIPEFPFGGMEHAGATFLRESAIIFPQEPTKNDLASRATLIFHETAHQWFGDTVTMRWFDDLWLKEGFATFTAYKAMEKIMPEMNAWKVFYERIKQGAYQTDSTRGTTAIYQPIANLSAAKSAYGNIVYNKAPAFLRQAEFSLGEDKFQTAVRAFLKKHEFGNAGWEDLVKEFEAASGKDLKKWAETWVSKPGNPFLKAFVPSKFGESCWGQRWQIYGGLVWDMKTRAYLRFPDGTTKVADDSVRPLGRPGFDCVDARERFGKDPVFFFPNYQDYGYGIFLLDDKSRDYVLKNIQNEKDPFLRTMMWGALWDGVREGELDPRVFVELVVKVLQRPAREQGLNAQRPDKALANAQASATEGEDESTIATLLGRTGTALNYYMSVPPAVAGGAVAPGVKTPPATAGGTDLRGRVEDMLIERMRNAPTLGQRITFYRAFLNIGSSDKARGVLKDILNLRFEIRDLKLKTKDKFDIVTRLLILGDPDAPRLLAELEKTETSDDAKRYAYAARAGIGTAENKAKYWNDFVSNKEISESWIEAAFGPWNSIRHAEMTLPYLERALKELPNHKRNRKIFFVNGWLGAFIGGQRSAEALAIVNKFLADNPGLDSDLRLKILENMDLIERAVRIREKHGN